MKRDTVGKISSELLQKEPDTRDPIELQRAMHGDYEKHIYEATESGKKKHLGSFYVVVTTKQEKLMPNVIRNYFHTRSSCPTPEWDQTVYKYHRSSDGIEFLWVVPSKDTCEIFKDNVLEIDESERGLLSYVLEFYDGTLMELCKKLNNEADDSPFLKKG